MQHLYSTDPTQETRPRPCRLDGSPPRHIRYIIQIRNLSALKDLDHERGIGDLSDAWNVVKYKSVDENERDVGMLNSAR